METNVRYTVVGLFVIGLIAATILVIIWLSAGFSLEDYRIYQVFMKESVSGLTIEAPVEYNGVGVGSVVSIGINHQNPQLVDLLLKIKSDTPITEGTRAKLGSRALSGVSFILLEDKGFDKKPLEIKSGHPYAVINTTPSLYFRLDDALTQINNSFNQLSKSINSLITPENLKYVKRLLQSSSRSMDAVQGETIPAFNQVISNLDMLTHDLASVTREIKQNPSILIRGRQTLPLGPGESR